MGRGYTYVVDERTALVVGGRGVAVLDISDPANVMCVAKVKKTDGLTSGQWSGRIAIIPNTKVALLTSDHGCSVLRLQRPAEYEGAQGDQEDSCGL